ncbi:MAG: phosphohydrolase [Deltaproteobacteria bacterium]|nr:MAG: phosphohydrolase [Deltaproteobacteria bacterium]
MDLKRMVDLLFEAGMLSRTPRTGYRFLGTGKQSVAEHLFRTAVVGYVLAHLDGRADKMKVVMMCLFHDLMEARTGDQNYVYKKYVKVDEEKALEEMTSGLPFGKEIKALLKEFNAQESREALLSHDADQLELILQLKEEKDLGNRYAEEWLRYNIRRLRTEAGKRLAEAILQRDFSAWWFDKGDEQWWVKGK